MKRGDISEFSKELSKLRKSRKQWKLLSDEEINQCLANITETFKQKPPLFQCEQYINIIILIIKLTATILLALGVTVVYFPDSQFSQKLISGMDDTYSWWSLNHAYTWQRWIRHLMLPVQPLLVQIIGHHQANCFINNPFSSNPYTDRCDLCENITDVRQDLQRQFLSPLLIRNAGSKMCFDDIQQFVSHEISHSKQNTSSLHLSVAVLEELSKVFNPDIKHLLTDNAKSQHKWASRDYRSGHVLRKLFPWTNSLLKNIEIGVEKLLVIDGVTRPWYKMDILEIFDLGPIMYLQSCSEKEMKFYPINSCSNRCSPLPSIKLQASDIVIWQSALWEPEFHPVAGSKELSLAVLAAAN